MELKETDPFFPALLTDRNPFYFPPQTQNPFLVLIGVGQQLRPAPISAVLTPQNLKFAISPLKTGTSPPLPPPSQALLGVFTWDAPIKSASLIAGN